MARPIKDGVDYFPLDTVLDTKFEMIEAEFGLTGFAIIVKLFQRIYGEQGYYCEWTEEVALLFSHKCGISNRNCEGGNVVSEIVRAAIKRGIFDKVLYDRYQILTSKGIQERYFEAVSRRKIINVKNEYLLVDVAKISNNVNINQVNVNINPENVSNNTQTKEKEIKQNKTIRKHNNAHFAQFWAAYPKKVGKSSAEKAFAKINPDDELLKAIINAIDKQSKSEQWTKDDGQFIPYPATWLNGKRWEDDLTVVTAKKDTSYNIEQIETKANNFSNLGW